MCVRARVSLRRNLPDSEGAFRNKVSWLMGTRLEGVWLLHPWWEFWGSWGPRGGAPGFYWRTVLQALEKPLHIGGGGVIPVSAQPRALPFQMTLYLTFPVAMFWIANQAEWFEDYVIQRKVGARRVFLGSFQGEDMRQCAGDR